MISEITGDPMTSMNLAMLLMFVATILFGCAAIQLAFRVGNIQRHNEYLQDKNDDLESREREWVELTEAQAADIHILEGKLETYAGGQVEVVLPQDEDEMMEMYGTPSPEKTACNGAFDQTELEY